MKTNLVHLLPFAILIGLVLIMPTLGAVLGQLPLELYLELPLTARADDPLPFDARLFAAACLLLVSLLALVLWLAWPIARGHAATPPTKGRLPGYSLIGMVLLAGGVAMAADGVGTAGSALALLGVILLSNADSHRRTGNSLLDKRPGYLLALFPASLVLGWAYHWLNLYLQLWVYVGEHSDRVGFVLARSVEYAVLLPALLSLRQWLASLPGLLAATGHGRPLDLGDSQAGEGWLLLGLGVAMLAAAPLWSDWAFAPAWLAPLLLALGLTRIRGKGGLFAGISRGDWSRELLASLAAIMLGLMVLGMNRLAGAPVSFELPLIDAARVLGLAAPAYAGLIPLGLLGLWSGDQIAGLFQDRAMRPDSRFPVQIQIGQ